MKLKLFNKDLSLPRRAVGLGVVAWSTSVIMILLSLALLWTQVTGNG